MAPNASGTIPQNLTFVFTVESLSPNFTVQDNQSQNNTLGFWTPPDRRNAYIRGTSIMFRWRSGRVSLVPADDPVRNMNPTIHSVATVFTQNPNTQHFIAVNIDAGERDVRDQNGGWRTLSFNHRVNPGNARTYSSLNIMGQEGHLAATGSPSWMPQLLPRVYDYQPHFNQFGAPAAVSAGLIGDIPILIALAVFSAPEGLLVPTLTNSIQPGAWRPHTYMLGHNLHRGMVVTVRLDPTNPVGSTTTRLNQLQDGHFGPFYGP